MVGNKLLRKTTLYDKNLTFKPLFISKSEFNGTYRVNQ